DCSRGRRLAAAEARRAAHLPLGHGAEFLGRDLGVDVVLRGDHRRERGHGAPSGERVDGAGLQSDAAHRRPPHGLVHPAGDCRYRRARPDARAQPSFLVSAMSDLRLPLGLLLAFYGVILSATGAIDGTLVVGVNVNLWWGVVLIVFGSAMVYLARRADAAD